MASQPSLGSFLRAKLRRRCGTLMTDLRTAQKALNAFRVAGKPNAFCVEGHQGGDQDSPPAVSCVADSLEEAFAKALAELDPDGPKPSELAWFAEAYFDGGVVPIPREYWPPGAAGGRR